MKKIAFIIVVFLSQAVVAQNTFKAIIRDSDTKDVLIGASAVIKGTSKGASTNENGFLEIKNIPDGKQVIEFNYIGYNTRTDTFKFPLTAPEPVVIYLSESHEELQEVVVTTTRSSRSMENIPTRVEVIASDELHEEGTIKPGQITKLLRESTGISTQQTSAVSAISGFRIQGLDSRYTQLLKDGMPLYQGFSGGLSIMQIAPLDLKQVEIIKGSASTLYGGGAIAGLINLISKKPGDKKEKDFLLNATSAKGSDGSVFYSQKFKKIGTTLFGSYNYNAPYDPSNTGFTAIPQTNRITFNPKLFLYFNKKNSAWLGLNFTYEDRYGGDLKVIEGEADSLHRYFEHNLTNRISSQFSFSHRTDSAGIFHFKNSVGIFDRSLSQPGIHFNGRQVSSFSEFNYVYTKEKTEWITGLNLWTDDFHSAGNSGINYNLTTAGIFVQNTFSPVLWFSLESGLRVDHNSPSTNDRWKGNFILPRINTLFKIGHHFTSRIGGGFGYKMPSPFNTEAEAEGYRNMSSFSIGNTNAEKSYGGNLDINFSTNTDDYYLSADQLFFYTYIDKPLILQGNTLVNASGNTVTKGAETNLNLNLEDFSLFLGYTFTDARNHFNGQDLWQPLTAKNRLIADIMYEKETHFRAGFETYFVSKQLLSDGITGRDYVTFDLLFEKEWEHFDLFINADNITDQRQTRWDTIYTGTLTTPRFKDIYAPLEGRIINAGIKINLQ